MVSNKYLIVIPAYNEERKLQGVIKATQKHNPFADILVINDGSDDNTLKIAEQAGAMVLDLTNNLGYGCAIQTGFRFATENNYDYVITIDGDGQHDPASVKNLIKKLSEQNADVVIGSRFLEGHYEMEFARKTGAKIFSFITYLYTKIKFTDPTSGFQLLNNKAFTYLSESDKYPIDYPDANILIALHKANFKVVEAPVQMFRKLSSKSMHSGLRPFFYIIRMTLAIMIQSLRKE
jgi:glycosyltransferase involved in cell wall biosynthesis